MANTQSHQFPLQAVFSETKVSCFDVKKKYEKPELKIKLENELKEKTTVVCLQSEQK